MSKKSDKIKKMYNDGYGINSICKTWNLTEENVRIYLLPDNEMAKIKKERKNFSLRKSFAKMNKIKIKERQKRWREKALENPNYVLSIKIKQFIKNSDSIITVEDFLNKFGNNPTCYLTGMPIDLRNASSYSLDHKIPKSLGGESSLDNMGITLRQINYMKHYLKIEEFIKLCQLVVDHNLTK